MKYLQTMRKNLKKPKRATVPKRSPNQSPKKTTAVLASKCTAEKPPQFFA